MIVTITAITESLNASTRVVPTSGDRAERPSTSVMGLII